MASTLEYPFSDSEGGSDVDASARPRPRVVELDTASDRAESRQSSATDDDDFADASAELEDDVNDDAGDDAGNDSNNANGTYDTSQLASANGSLHSVLDALDPDSANLSHISQASHASHASNLSAISISTIGSGTGSASGHIAITGSRVSEPARPDSPGLEEAYLSSGSSTPPAHSALSTYSDAKTPGKLSALNGRLSATASALNGRLSAGAVASPSRAIGARESKTIDELEREIFDLKLKIVLLEEEATGSDDFSVRELKKNMRNTAAELLMMRKENDELRMKLAAQDRARSDVEDKASHHRALQEEAEIELNEKDRHIQELTEYTDDLARQLNDLEARLATSEADNQQLLDEVDALNEENRRIAGAASAASARNLRTPSYAPPSAYRSPLASRVSQTPHGMQSRSTQPPMSRLLNSLTSENDSIRRAMRENRDPYAPHVSPRHDALLPICQQLEQLALSLTTEDAVAAVYERTSSSLEIADVLIHLIEACLVELINEHEEQKDEAADLRTNLGDVETRLLESEREIESLLHSIKTTKIANRTHVEQLQDQLNRRNSVMRDSESKLREDASAAITDAKDALAARDKIQQEMTAVRSTLDRIISTVRENYDENADEKSVVECIDKAFAIIGEVQQVSNNVDELSRILQDRESKLKSQSEEIGSARQQVADIRAQKDEAEKAFLKQKIELEASLASAKEQFDKKSTECAELATSLNEVTARYDEVSSRAKVDGSKVEGLMTRENGILAEKQQLVLKLASVEQQLAHSKQETESLGRKIGRLEESLGFEKLRGEQLEKKLTLSGSSGSSGSATTLGSGNAVSAGLQAFKEENYQRMLSLQNQIDQLVREKKTEADKVKFLETKAHESRESSYRLMHTFFQKAGPILGGEAAGDISRQFDQINADRSKSKLMSMEKLMIEVLDNITDAFGELKQDTKLATRDDASSSSDNDKLWKARYLAMKGKFNAERESRYAEYVSYIDRINQHDAYIKKLEGRRGIKEAP